MANNELMRQEEAAHQAKEYNIARNQLQVQKELGSAFLEHMKTQSTVQETVSTLQAEVATLSSKFDSMNANVSQIVSMLTALAFGSGSSHMMATVVEEPTTPWAQRSISIDSSKLITPMHSPVRCRTS